MKIIDYDVSKRIPPITENDVETKIIISHSISDGGNNFIDYVIRNNDGIFMFRGNLKNCITDNWLVDVSTWEDRYNNGKTIMDLLLKKQTEMEKRRWTTIHYIVESYNDLLKIINTFDITGNLKTELMVCWEKLPVNQKA